jgi:hypothetical protein
MKSDNIYFGATGITSASANHVANMAKESISEIVNDLDAVSFYNATVCLLSGGNPQQAAIGSRREDIDKVQASLESIGEANALIAWLREAVKARERMLQEVKDMTLADYCRDVLGGADVPTPDTNVDQWMKDKGYVMPDINGDFPDVEKTVSFGIAVNRIDRMCRKFGLAKPKQPVQEPAMTEDDYMATLSVKDRNRMLMLNAKAAAIGKYIHPDGHLAKERRKLRHVVAYPAEMQGEGADTVVYRFEPSVSQGEADGLFFRLSAEHRALQAELNGLLAERDRTIEADKQRKAAAYQEATAAFSREMSVLQDRLNAYMAEERKRMSELHAEYSAWSTEQKNIHKQLCADMEAFKIAEAKRIAGLGIIIPNELRAVYDRVNGLGKDAV